MLPHPTLDKLQTLRLTGMLRRIRKCRCCCANSANNQCPG